jgi:hypothetical protein
LQNCRSRNPAKRRSTQAVLIPCVVRSGFRYIWRRPAVGCRTMRRIACSFPGPKPCCRPIAWRHQRDVEQAVTVADVARCLRSSGTRWGGFWKSRRRACGGRS